MHTQDDHNLDEKKGQAIQSMKNGHLSVGFVSCGPRSGSIAVVKYCPRFRRLSAVIFRCPGLPDELVIHCSIKPWWSRPTSATSQRTRSSLVTAPSLSARTAAYVCILIRACCMSIRVDILRIVFLIFDYFPRVAMRM